MNAETDFPIRVGVSTCLLGERVRYDGGHKLDRFVTKILADYFSFYPVCPEVEVGMPTPREAVRLVGKPDSPRMVGRKTGEDWTDRMHSYTARRVRELEKQNLSGYIFQKGSPSCGIERVKVYTEDGHPGATGAGMFAKAVRERYPLLPVEDEGRLNDNRLRENFIERVFAYHRLQTQVLQGRFSRKTVIDFHTRHKYLIMAHSQKHYRELGKLVAAIKEYTPVEFRDLYAAKFMEAMAIKANPKKHTNVLLHIVGHFKKLITGEDKQYLLGVIEDYRNHMVPLVVPITLLKHYVSKYDTAYVADQYYLNPHPKELMLRNHV